MKQKLPISVVIPTMNRVKSLQRTVDGILEKKYIPQEIVVVDQSYLKDDIESTKNYINSLKEDITIKYIYQSKPSSTIARNTGFNQCKSDIIVFSDDDVDVNNETFINLYNLMSNEKYAMIAGIDENMYSGNSKIGYILGTKSYKKKDIGHVTKSMLGRYPNKIIGEVETEWAMGYFFVIRKSLSEKWNIKWDENLTSYAYAEDLDYSYSYYKKAKQEGLECILSDKVKVKHLVSKEWRVQSFNSTLMYIINREYLSYKHNMGFISRIYTRWTNFSQIIYRILKNQAPKDIIKAQIYCDMYRRDVKNGNLNRNLFK